MCVFKEEKKIDLDSNKTEAITERCSTKLLLFPWCQKFWKLLAKKLEIICFAELMLEPYDFTKMNSFPDIFHMILLRSKVFAFSHLEFQEHLLCRACLLCDCCASEGANSTLWFFFKQNQQYMQGFFDILLYISFLMGSSWKQCFWAFTVTLPSLK